MFKEKKKNKFWFTVQLEIPFLSKVLIATV